MRSSRTDLAAWGESILKLPGEGGERPSRGALTRMAFQAKGAGGHHDR